MTLSRQHFVTSSHYFILVSALGIPVHWLTCKEDFTCCLGEATCALLVIYSLIHRTPILKGPNKCWPVQLHVMVPVKEKFRKTEPWKIMNLLYTSQTFSPMKHLDMTAASNQDWCTASSLPGGGWLSAKQRS